MTNLEDNNWSGEVLQKIKAEKITPKPKWQFWLKNSLIWILGILSLVLGAISTSLIFYMLTGEESGFGSDGLRNFKTLFVIVPFFWIICLAFFAILVFYYFKHTKKGYKYSPKLIILGIFILSLIFGGTLSAFGLDRVIDDVLGEKAPMYNQVINPRMDYWSNPDDGRLTGLIISQEDEMTYQLVDLSGAVWVTKTESEEEAKKIKVDHPVRLMGDDVGDHNFKIEKVMSVGPGRRSFKRSVPQMPPGESNSDKCHNEQGCKKKKANVMKEKVLNEVETELNLDEKK